MVVLLLEIVTVIQETIFLNELILASFCLFSNNNLHRKIVDFNGIQTSIVRIEAITLTTAQYNIHQFVLLLLALYYHLALLRQTASPCITLSIL